MAGRNKSTYLLLLILMLGVSIVTFGGGVFKAKFTETLGIQPLNALPAAVKAGTTIEATTVMPEKLSTQGFPGAKRNDRVYVTVLEEGKRFSVRHAASGISRIFVINEKGQLIPEK